MTPGRRIYSLTLLGERVKLADQENEQEDLSEISEAVAEAIAHDRHVLELDAKRLVGSKISVREHDIEVDSNLVMIDRLLGHYAKKGDADASALASSLFPISVAHHIQLTYVEQAVANERVLDILEDTSRKPWLQARGVWPFVEQTRTAHDVFAAALKARDSATAPSWDQVKAARELGQELYLGVVALILARFRKDPARRDALLEPIYAQDELIRLLRRQRRTIGDVDPDSGEPLASEGEGEGGDEVTVDAGSPLEPSPVDEQG